ncbi:MAG: hypothetical protein KF900_09015 [Bacteroidetes bacterium]|nr:hypothetical protein [Bacteroidota bacterium]
MKKLFLMAAFAGLLTSAAVANTNGDDKNKGKDKKECCKKGDSSKSCAGEKKDATASNEKACCKKGGATAEAGKETKAAESKK